MSRHQMWGGRFTTGPAEAMRLLNDSLPVDIRLWPHDIRASKAWVNGLAHANVLTVLERQQLSEGLDRVAEKLTEGASEGARDEDVHTLIERLLFEEIGHVAGKLHTGRSRNDQVSTDLRLWCREALDQLSREVVRLGSALVQQAADGMDIVMPGYTHAQQAQPVRWSFVLLAHAWPLQRDLDRLADTRHRVNILPLGSGALAGSGIDIDRVLLQNELGFDGITGNALDATGDRDYVAEMLFVVAMIATHVSRLGSELVTYSSTEYGFIRVSDEFSTGSSLVPQKRNPDAFELARGKAAYVLGDLTRVMAMMHGLPAGYSKDLQDDKRPLFDAVDTVLVTLKAMQGAVVTLQPRPERMMSALQPQLLATDLADLLVEEGIPFRQAHRIVGEVVALAEKKGISFLDIESGDLSDINATLPSLVARIGGAEWAIERRPTQGSTSRASVQSQIDELQKVFAVS